MNTSARLTLEQQFALESMRHTLQQASREEVLDMLLSVSQLLMVKDNVIKELVRQTVL